MDIEGLELSTLRDAGKTVQKFRPKLAICLYHSLDGFTFIPKFMNELDISYIFYIDHFTMRREMVEASKLASLPAVERVGCAPPKQISYY